MPPHVDAFRLQPAHYRKRCGAPNVLCRGPALERKPCDEHFGAGERPSEPPETIEQPLRDTAGESCVDLPRSGDHVWSEIDSSQALRKNQRVLLQAGTPHESRLGDIGTGI